MNDASHASVLYQRSQFATELPAGRLYTSTHAWLVPVEGGVWRVGLTKFATRLLGEPVDHGFSVAPGSLVQPGDIVGWVEGFKAISDLGCVAEGAFAGGNEALKEEIVLITRDPYGTGWLYEVKGQPDPSCMDVHTYCEWLDKTVERMLARQQET